MAEVLNYTFQVDSRVDFTTLDKYIRAQLTDKISGCSMVYGSGEIILHFYNEPSPVLQNQIQNYLYNTIDPTIISYLREGSVVTINVWLPLNRSNLTEIGLVIDGLPLPENVPLAEDGEGGVSGTVEIVDDEAFTVVADHTFRFPVTVERNTGV